MNWSAVCFAPKTPSPIVGVSARGQVHQNYPPNLRYRDCTQAELRQAMLMYGSRSSCTRACGAGADLGWVTGDVGGAE